MPETLLEKAQRLGIQPQGEQGGIIEEAVSDIKQTRTAVGQQFKQAGEKIVETAISPELTLAEKARAVGAEAFRGGARVFGEAVIGAGKVVLPQRAEEAIKRGVEKVGERLGETEIVQNLLGKYKMLPPDAQREVDNALGFAEGLGEIITFGGLSKVASKTLEIAIAKTSKINPLVTKTVQQATPDSIKTLNRGLNPGQKDSAVTKLFDTYQKSFVDDRPAVSKQLEKQAKKQTRKGDFVDSTKLLSNLAEDARNGVLPYVEGKLIKFDNVIFDLEKRQDNLAQNLDPFLGTITVQTKLSDLRKAAESSLRTSSQIRGAGELKKSFREIDRFIEDFREGFGDILSAQDLNEIRIGMNARSRSFVGEEFRKDSAFSIADATRSRIDELVPEGIANKVNAEWGRLEDMKRTADILHNQTINIGVLGGQLGRYLGVLGLSTAGLNVGGPGALVIAGIAAHFGGEAIAQLLRNRRFGKKLKAEIIDTIRRDEELVRQLIAETEGANKEFLERLFLPSPGQTSVIELPPAKLGTGPGSRIIKPNETPKKKVNNIPKELQPLAEEARKFKTAKEFVENQTKVFHGGAGIEALRKEIKILTPEEKLKFPSSGGGFVGLSTSADKATAIKFSKNIGGTEDVVEIFINPNARIKKIIGDIDDTFTGQELEDLVKQFDIIQSTGAEKEFRILNADVIKTKSQLTDIFNKVKANAK